MSKSKRPDRKGYMSCCLTEEQMSVLLDRSTVTISKGYLYKTQEAKAKNNDKEEFVKTPEL
jgi:hypothetical protein